MFVGRYSPAHCSLALALYRENRVRGEGGVAGGGGLGAGRDVRVPCGVCAVLCMRAHRALLRVPSPRFVALPMRRAQAAGGRGGVHDGEQGSLGAAPRLRTR